MAPLPLPMHRRSIRNGGLTAGTEAVGASRRHRRRGPTVLTMVGHSSEDHQTSRLIPIRRPIPGLAVGTPISGHDISGAGWQTVGRAMQSITTMIPVW